MKVLLATGIEKLDREITGEMAKRGIEPAGEAYYRGEDLVGLVRSSGADVVVLSPALPPKEKENDVEAFINEVVLPVREAGARVILLPGKKGQKETENLVEEAILLGVYDIVYDTVEAVNVVDKIVNPATISSAMLKEIAKKDDLINRMRRKLNEAVRATDKAVYPRKNAGKEDAGREDFLLSGTALSYATGNETVADQDLEEVKSPAPVFFRKQKVPNTGHGHNKPSVILGLGNTELENWFETTFSNDVEVIYTIDGLDDFKQKLTERYFEIAVLMRLGPLGGVPAADVIAEWAVQHVPAVLYIAGETDQEGSEIILRLKAAGVKHIISCPVGEFITGEELVFTMHNILREMRRMESSDVRPQEEPDAERPDKIKVDTLQSLKYNAARLSQVLKRTLGKPNEKRIKIKNHDEGVAFDEKPTPEIYNENIKNPTAIVQGGVFAVVSPWRPGLAGRLAAQAVKLFSEVEGGEVAYIGASAHSTGALWLDMPEEELMMSDWRVPGSQCPVKKDNLTIYAVDPAKDLRPESENETWAILKEARKTATYTVMDLGGDMDMALKAAHQGRVVILVILPGADPVELKVSQLWLRNLQEGKKNIVVGIDLRGCPPVMPEGVKPKVVVRNNPADALAMALRRTQDDEFVWN